MKRRILTAVAVSALLLTAVSPALAAPASREVRQNENAAKNAQGQGKSLRQNISDKIQAIKQAVKDRLSQARRNRVQNWWDNSHKRLQRLIDRETKLADNVQKRLDRFSVMGKDISAQKTMMSDLRSAINDAQNGLNAADGQVPAILSDNTPNDALKQLHDLSAGVTDKIRVAHNKLTGLISSLRGLSGAGPTPTPSPSSSTSPTPTPSASASPSVTP